MQKMPFPLCLGHCCVKSAEIFIFTHGASRLCLPLLPEYISMKHRFAIFLLACLGLASCEGEDPSAFGPETTFMKLYGNASSHLGAAAVPAPDGGYAFVGNREVANSLFGFETRGKGVLVKADPEGNPEWELLLDTVATSMFSCLAIDAAGNYVMAGGHLKSSSASFDNIDLRVASVSPAGELRWVRDFGDLAGPSAEIATKVLVAANGDYLVMGYTATGSLDIGGITPNTDMYALRLRAADGALIWQKVYGWQQQLADEGIGLLEEADGNLLWLGHAQAPSGEFRMRLAKTNAQGDVLWDVAYELGAGSQRSSAMAFYEGGIALLGIGSGQYVLLQADRNGQLLRSTSLDLPNGLAVFPGDLAVTPAGRLLVAGTYRPSNGGEDDMLLLETDGNANIKWWRRYGGGNADFARSISVLPDGGLLLAGTLGFESNSLMALFKTDASGRLDP
jgi:hypothetical protein